ncbi:ketoacyl-ACP synthase III [soil metagenome]
MRPINTKPIGILGLGVHVPEKILSNFDLEKMVETNDEWIRTRTGIRERRILSDGESPSDIALPAAQKAIADSGLSVKDIDAVVYCTYTPDHFMPPSSCIMQGRLGLQSCIAFDLNAACSGFVFGLQAAYALVVSGQAKHPLVIGADCNSRVLDYTDRETCVLFGDGAGAVVLGNVPEGRGILGHSSGSDGTGAFLITQKVGGGAHPYDKENIASKDRFMKMNGREVYKFAVRVINEALEAALADAGLDVKDIDLLVPHQANVRIIESAMKRFGFDPKNVVINMAHYGNTSAASIPLALDSARRDGRLKPGVTCGLVAFGAGLTHGATILRW